MREENRRLLIDIQLMTREIDMFNNGQGKIVISSVRFPVIAPQSFPYYVFLLSIKLNV